MVACVKNHFGLPDRATRARGRAVANFTVKRAASFVRAILLRPATIAIMPSPPSTPCCTEDLKHQYTVTSEEFLNGVLHLPPDWINKNASQIDDIVHNQCFGKMVSECLEPVTDEIRHPFILLANHVASQLNPNPDSRICFCCNNPVLIDHSQVRYKSLEVPERWSVDNVM
jgi:hypothetical protein